MTAHDVAFLEKYCRRARTGAWVLLGAWVLIVSFAGDRHRTLEDLLAFAVGVDVLLWCVVDARLHEKYFEHAFAIPFLLTWPVTLAVYLVWTRGGRPGLYSYAAAVLLGAAVAFVGAVLGACLRAVH